MNEQTLIWLFGGMATVFGVWNIALTGLWWGVRNDMKDTKLAVDMYIRGMGKAAAMVIHRDDDLWGLDSILDRYKKNNQELSLEDWIKLEAVMKKLSDDKTVADGTKLAMATLAFAMLAEFAQHKIFGQDPRIKLAIKEALK